MRFRLQILFFIFIAITHQCCAQSVSSADSASRYKTVIAGEQYKKNAAYRFFWGNNYRKVWTTAITVPILWLDTAKGGLKPVKQGGGHQTKSLRLKNNEGKEYAVRSISKTLGAVLPENFKGTFIQDIVNDEVSMSNPYSALIVPVLAENAHVYHTNPVLVYLPKQPLLDTFNDTYGNNFYLFEQKPDGDWSDADNLGNFKNFLSTEEVIKKMLGNNHYKIDQPAFVRARIFDWFINDWDRHEAQWSWGEKKVNDEILFEPVPQDRDQAFSKHDGFLLTPAMAASGLSYMQSFDKNLKSIKKFNYEERNLDSYFFNETSLHDWQSIAADLQQSLTNDVIDKAVKQLPSAVYTVSGNTISENLKARRTHLAEWATTYYSFISKEVQVTGSKQNEQFNVERLNNNETSVKIYNKLYTTDSPFYARTFNLKETEEVRLFGISGSDVYHITGSKNDLKIKTIGGAETDSVINESAGRLYVYDDKNGNYINSNPSTKLRLSSDTSVHNFDYNWFKFNKGHVKPSLFYNFYDRIYVGLGYQYVFNKWRKEPFASKHLFDVHYSLSEGAFSFTYSALFPKLIGNADFSLLANYDIIRWIRFWGLGNETQYKPKDRVYFTARSRQWIFQPGIIKRFGANSVSFAPFIQGVQVLNDTAKFISKTFITNPQDYKWKTFAGAAVNYKFIKLNDSIVPTKGILFSADASAAQNLKESSRYYAKIGGSLQVFVPLAGKFSYVFRTGAATLTGKPEFYQYNMIGGGPNLRGFKRDRFRGKTTFWNTHDIRFISPVKSYLYNGKAGLIAFFDNGRVWLPGENSNTWHTDAGAGVTLAPFNKILADVTYGFSKDGHVIQIKVSKYF